MPRKTINRGTHMQFLNTNRTNGLELLIKTPCSTSFGQGDRLDEFLDELAL